MFFGSPAEIFGMDGIIVLVVVVLVLFGSTQIPKLARSLGSAQKEFKKGVHEGTGEDSAVIPERQTVAVVSPDVISPAPTGPTGPTGPEYRA